MVALERRGTDRGYTMIELIIASVIALIVVLAMGKLILVNQSSWEGGRDKAVLQANVTESLEWMARSIRAARTAQVVDVDEFRTYDESGNLAHTYRLVVAGGGNRLQEDGQDLINRNCTQFVVAANADTTSLTLTLELEDKAGDRVAGMSRTTLRNRTLEF
jgi:prepilin-type N-terminal cleavage/methylation domain-containing protein